MKARYHIYLAENLTYQRQKREEEKIGLTGKKVKLEQFMQWILEGKITDATSVTAFLLARAKNLVK